MPKDTSIGVNEEMWTRLNREKKPGDSFEDVIGRALDERDELEERLKRLEESAPDDGEHLGHGDAPRELVIGEESDPLGRVQLVDDKHHDVVIADALRSLGDALEESAPDDALRTEETTFVIDGDGGGDAEGERGDRVDAGRDETSAPVDVADVLDGETLPGSGDKLRRRIEAVEACYRLLRERGEVQTSEFKEELFDDYPAGYETPNSWWKNSTYSGLAELANHDAKLKVADTAGKWRYDG